MTAVFLLETMKSRKPQNDIFKPPKGKRKKKKLPTPNSMQQKISLRHEHFSNQKT